MNKVRILPEIVANKIAAGEVVERPASVVKELIENAIDAKAKAIIVSVREEGQFISVTDDGTGMSEEDARLSVHRHSTSKIYDPEDLHNITSLGFRGEALASIASVSELTLLTREKNAAAGTKVDIRGGQITAVQSAPHPPGTKIEVRHLFYNTPARYKFLKSVRVEMQHVKTVLILQALVHPEISFRYLYNDQQTLDFPSTMEPLQRIRNVFSSIDWQELLEIEWFGDNFSITGFISRPQHSRKDKKHQFLFVNSRPVMDNNLFYALRLAYQDLIETHRHPFAVVYINIHPELIDVNVHPNKYEIRFKDEREIFNALREAVNNTLLQLKGPQNISLSSKIPVPFHGGSAASYGNKGRSRNLFPASSSPDQLQWRSPKINTSHLNFDDAPFSILGQFFHTYILVLKEKDILIIDQHALHEKILYYKLKEQDKNHNLRTELIVPEVIEVALQQKKLFEEIAIPNLEDLGYTIECFGGKSFVIKTYPTVLKNIDHKMLIMDYIEELADEKMSNRKPDLEKFRETLVILSCCKKAVKKGAELNETELYELVRQYFESPDKYQYCPHGRPVVLSLDQNELDRYFHRDY